MSDLEFFDKKIEKVLESLGFKDAKKINKLRKSLIPEIKKIMGKYPEKYCESQ